MKDGIMEADNFECVKNALCAMELSSQNMICVTTYGCPSLTVNNVGKTEETVIDGISEVDYNKRLISLHCIIHQ